MWEPPRLHGGLWRADASTGTSTSSGSTGEQGRVRVCGRRGAGSVSLRAACAPRMIMYVKRKVYVTHIKGV